jgi:hypothetical protein
LLVFAHTTVSEELEPPKGERFSFGSLSFDVYQAYQLIKNNLISYKKETINVEDYMKILGISVDKSIPLDQNDKCFFLMRVDWKYAAGMSKNKLSVPGILVATKFGPILIDGNHRLVRLAHNNIEEMPVYYISNPSDVLKITFGQKKYLAAKKELSKKRVQAELNLEGDPQAKMTVGNLHFDQENGIGQVPFNQEIGYRGFAVLMTPNQFFRLTPTRDFRDSSLIGIKKAIKAGKAIGSPFISLDKNKNKIYVTGHEGRTRMKAIEELYGQVPVLVRIFTKHFAVASKLTDDEICAINTSLVPEKSKSSIKGPFFDRRLWHLNKWKNVGQPSLVESAVRRIVTFSKTNFDSRRMLNNLAYLDIAEANPLIKILIEQNDL